MIGSGLEDHRKGLLKKLLEKIFIALKINTWKGQALLCLWKWLMGTAIGKTADSMHTSGKNFKGMSLHATHGN